MKISKEILLEAVTKSLKNAEQLFEEGQLLKVNQRLARAYTLFQLALEEVGKATLAFSLLFRGTFNDKEEKKLFEDGFRSHKIKTWASAKINIVALQLADDAETKKALIEDIMQ